jgi:RNA polymerase sigma factor (sigma-70 family)
MKRTAFLQQVVRQLRQTAEARQLGRASDAELLGRVKSGGDPEAFEAIVRRYGACVLAACRKVLPDPTDAEDAFQATFLVLLQNARAVRQPQLLRGWLCGVAHRVALKALAASARHRRTERRKAPAAAEAPDLSWREACAILHEELDRLPDTYRLPLILCYLEGKSRDEAAAQLGVETAVLHGRLQRGRDRLRSRLTKRGIALSAGLLAAVANSVTAGGPPEHLLRATLKAAATGHFPAKVAALVHGASLPMTVGKVKLASVALLAVGLLVAGVGLAASGPRPQSVSGGTHAAAPEVRPQPSPETAKEAGETLELKGRVVDADGKPVAGAKILVVSFIGKEDGFEPVAGPEPTGADGRFRFKVPTDKVRLPKYDLVVPALVATAPGYCPGWDGGRRGWDDMTIRLAKEDAKVTGRVVNLEGKPVAGATVRVVGVLAPAEGNLDPWLAALKGRRKEGADKLEQEFLPVEIPADVLPDVTLKATTDADGRFELAGYGKERVLKVVVEGPTIASREVRFVTRAMETVQLPMHNNPEIPGATAYYGINGVHPAPPTRLVTGVVRDRATNNPLAGIAVKSLTMAPHGRVGDQFLAQTVTDADGRFTLVGMPKGAGNSIVAVPDDRQPYAAATCEVPDPTGYDPVKVEVALVRGVWIEGTVTDRHTGKPIRTAAVEYYPDVYDNRTVKALPELKENYYSKDRFFPTATRGGGKFRVLGLPGKGYVVAVALTDTNEYRPAFERTGDGGTKREQLPTLPHIVSPRGYHAVYEVDIPADADPFRCAVSFEPASPLEREEMTVRGRVLDPDGKPAAGAEVFLLGSKRTGAKPIATADKDGKFHFTAKPADVGSDGRVLAVAADNTTDDGRVVGPASAYAPDWIDLARCAQGEVTLRLRKDDVPFTGRVLTLEGQPVAGATVEAVRLGAVAEGDDLKAWLDKNVRMHKEGYWLNERGLVTVAPSAFGTRITATTDKDGKFRLTGAGRDRVLVVRVTGDGIEHKFFRAVTRPDSPKDGYVKAPDFNYGLYGPGMSVFVAPAKPIVGTVTDRKTGKPLAGVTVREVEHYITRAVTDKDGRYRLEGVPKSAHYSFTAGGSESVPYFDTSQHAVLDTAGLVPLTVDFTMDRGLLLTGRAVEKGSGKPVAGLVHYDPSRDNPNLKDYPRRDQVTVTISSWGTVRPDGTFTLLVIPGPGAATLCAEPQDRFQTLDARNELTKLKVRSFPVDPAHAVAAVDPDPAKPPSLVCDFELAAGRVRKGTVVDADGKPLEGVLAVGVAPGERAAPLKSPEFTLSGLGSRKRILIFVHPEKKLGAVAVTSGDSDEPLTVKLRPLGTIEGRALDADGKPWAGLKVTLRPEVPGRDVDYDNLPEEFTGFQGGFGGHKGLWSKFTGRETTTDKDGRFRLDGVLPGVDFGVYVSDGDLTKRNTLVDMRRQVRVESGKANDLGVLKKGEAAKEE